MSSSPAVPQAYLVHAVAGRTRLRVPARRGDADWFARVVARLGALPAVAGTAATPRLGTLIIRHDGAFAPLAAAAEAVGLFALAAPLPPAPQPPVPAVARPRALPRVAPLSLVAGGLAGLAALQAARGQVAGNAVEIAWQGYHARVRLGLPMVSRLMIGVGLLQLLRGEVVGPASSLMFYALTARMLARERQAGG